MSRSFFAPVEPPVISDAGEAYRLRQWLVDLKPKLVQTNSYFTYK